MKTFILKRYDITSAKIPQGQTVRLILIADLHGSCYEENQEKLFRVIRIHRPDAVLAAGDMITFKKEASLLAASVLLRRLNSFTPVYYSMGNHELACSGRKNPGAVENRFRQAYDDYEKELEKAGVFLLHNQRRQLQTGMAVLDIAGLDLEKEYYRKPFPKRFSGEEAAELLGEPDPEAFQVLMAHTPRFGDAYFDWGADLTVSGHYHGGLVRLNEHRGLVSPYLMPFPRYCVGGFAREDQFLIVSPGLGDHSVQLRIHNPKEVSLITIYPAA